MTLLFQTIISFLLPLMAGFLVVQILFEKEIKGLSGKIALSYGVGMGILAQVMLWVCMFSIQLDFISVAVPLVLMIGGLSFFRSLQAERLKRTIPSGQTHTDNSSWTAKVFFIFAFVLIAINVYGASLELFSFPIKGWDSLATIMFKAKVLFYERSFTFIDRFPHNTYPLQVPFSVAWLSIAANQWNDQIFPALIYTGYIISFLLGFYFLARRIGLDRFWALTGILLLLSSNFLFKHMRIYYNDFPLAYYNLFTFLLLILWAQERKNAWLVLAAVFSGFGASVKLEGILYSGIHMLTIAFICVNLGPGSITLSRIAKVFGIFLGVLAALVLPFQIFKIFALPPLSYDGFTLQNIQLAFSFPKLWGIIRYAGIDLFISGNWSIIWFIFLLTLGYYLRNIKQFSLAPKILLFALGIFFLLVIGGFSSTPFYHNVVTANDPFSRIVLHFFPLVPVFIVSIGQHIDLMDLSAKFSKR